MYHGHSLYLDVLHVPLLVHFPKRISEGRRIAGSAGLDQIPVTILDLAGIRDARFPGRSLLAAALDSTGSDDPAFAEVARASRRRFNWPASKTAIGAALTDRWHLIMPLSGNVELYDLGRDRKELVNLADSIAYRPVLDTLRASLHRFGLEKLEGNK
jgi:arylsulfatase A-like enzyme